MNGSFFRHLGLGLGADLDGAWVWGMGLMDLMV